MEKGAKMKKLKKLSLLVVLLLVALLVCSCGTTTVCSEKDTKAESNTSMFIKLETTENWIVVYHKDTRVMYAVSNDAYIQGIFTMLVNADGTPMIYGG